MTPSLKQLRYFVEIVDAGNFSLAAERLFIAQSALSRQIRDMEAALQVELLVRKPRHVEPTAAGQAFYESFCPTSPAQPCRPAKCSVVGPMRYACSIRVRSC